MGQTVIHVEGERTREAARPLRARARTCVGCGERVHIGEADGGSLDLVRLTLGPDGALTVDPRGGAAGRGAHVHARPACLARAARGGLARSTKGRARSVVNGAAAGVDAAHPAAGPRAGVDAAHPAAGPRAGVDADSQARAIQWAMDRRIEGLVAAAVRSRRIARGEAAVTEACERGEAELVIVARDAAEAAGLPEVQRAVAAGRAVAWGDRRALARLASHEEEAGGAVVAIASRPIAAALRRAAHIAGACTAPVGAERTRHTRPRRAKKDDRSDG